MKIDKSMLELRKFLAPEFVFGPNSLRLVGSYAKTFALKRVMIATDSGVRNAGWLEFVINSLEAEGIEYYIFDTISPNPRDYEVELGAKAYSDEFCDGIIALGGGSVLDCAKGIGILAANRRNIMDFEGVNKVVFPMPPLICIPTTGGTSADVSQFAIINNSTDKYKMAIISKAVVPDLALIDPETLTTMDSYLTACTGIDALSHAFEAYASLGASSITDLFALEAVRLITDNLEKSIKQPDNLELRSRIMMASLQAGLAFSNASLGCIHSMAHSLGGYSDLAHGECNAILIDRIVDYNYDTVPTRYDDLAQAMGRTHTCNDTKSKKSELIIRIEDLKLSVGIKSRLTEKGITISDIPILASKAIKDPCNATNPKRPTLGDLETLYREAM